MDFRLVDKPDQLTWLNKKLSLGSVDMFVRQSWMESRLTLPNDIFEEGDDYVTLPPEFFDSLWQPDPYFLNSKVSGNYWIVFWISEFTWNKIINLVSMEFGSEITVVK